MTEIIFEVKEDEMDGGYIARALGHSIFTQGETLDELKQNVVEAVHAHFFDAPEDSKPSMVRLHIVRDEILAA